MASQQKAHQPLHPSIRPILDPEYVQYHDSVLQFISPSENEPWDPSSRLKPSTTAAAAQGLIAVGSTVDRELSNIQIRQFTPTGCAPENGWPSLVWFHGGGYVMGGLSSENGFLTHVCKHLACVVITINYRHAPEFKYPTAANDSFDGFEWIVKNTAALNLDATKIAIGGLSAGGGLCAVTTLKAVAQGIRPAFQLLICPVIDNTATTETMWAESKHSPWLTPSRMTWYRNMYFKKAEDACAWDASPIFAPEDLLSQSPPTFLAIAECDLLAPEGLAYGQKLRAAGTDVSVSIYRGATHSVLVLAGIHAVGKQLVHDACSALASRFGIPYNPESAPVLARQS